MNIIICKVYLTVKFTLHSIVRALRRPLQKKVTLFLLTLSNLESWDLVAQKQEDMHS